MKRIGNLYERVISLENLRLADERARKGKKRSRGVRLHDKNREENLRALHEQLKNHTFRTSAYHTFKIHEPKERIIFSLPYYPDRIVHHAVMQVMEETWTRALPHNSFACVNGRGIHGCARHVRRILKRHDGRPLYCLKLDIHKFYPSIDHEVLKRTIRRKIKDAELLALLDEIIDSADGLPIGNYLSQIFANLVLGYFLHRLNERAKDSAVYMDDIVVFDESKERLHELFREFIVPELTKIGLTVKKNHQVFPIAETRRDLHGRGLDFCGYVFFRRQTLLRKSIKQRLARKVVQIAKRETPLTERQQRIALAPWLGWCKHCQTKNLLNNLKNRIA